MHISRYSIFLIGKEKDKSDGKLRLRIKWDGNTVAFNVGYRVEPAKWSLDTQRCRLNTTHGAKKISASVINKAIARFEEIAEEVFVEYEKGDTMPTPEEFRKEFNRRSKPNSKTALARAKTFYEFYDEFTGEMGWTNQWTKATYVKFAALKNHLMDFAPKLTFESLDTKGLNLFVEYLRDRRQQRNSTTNKKISLLKWFLRWASAKGYNTNMAFTTFSPKLKTTDKKVIFLDWDELMKVYHAQIPQSKNYLERVRDVFCFCCFTSLRYSDVANLRRSNVFKDYISITTVKTSDSLKIEFNDYSRAILRKYKNETFADDLALPVISNQKMNNYIKELGKLCGIDQTISLTFYKGNQRIDEVYPKYELLGTHCGRRTFICNALMLGVSPQIVMKWTGHSDYKAMKPYIDITDRNKSEAMKVFNKWSPF